MVFMGFEWDDDKEEKNKKKHKISFFTAVKVFDDKYRVEWYDDIHSVTEKRYITVGRAGEEIMLLWVSFTERKENIRIISARLATKKEKEAYYNGTSSLY